jgi:hypothetical protein
MEREIEIKKCERKYLHKVKNLQSFLKIDWKV